MNLIYYTNVQTKYYNQSGCNYNALWGLKSQDFSLHILHI